MYAKKHKFQLGKVLKSPSWVFAILLFLVPKCPLCLMAYGSAITICGISSYHVPWQNYITTALILLMVVGIVKKYGGLRTLVSLGLILIATTMILYSSLTGVMTFYQIGSIITLGAAFTNRGMIWPHYRKKPMVKSHIPPGEHQKSPCIQLRKSKNYALDTHCGEHQR